MEIADITSLVQVFKDSGLQEFELERDGVRLRLVRGGQVAHSHSVAPISYQLPHGFVPANPQYIPSAVSTAVSLDVSSSELPPALSSKVAENDDTASLVKVESPIVGTFYRRPSPDAEPFVKEGDSVRKGATLCIIEAMKLMNEIESPCSGRIEKVLLGDGQVVEYGEVLLYIRPEV